MCYKRDDKLFCSRHFRKEERGLNEAYGIEGKFWKGGLLDQRTGQIRGKPILSLSEKHPLLWPFDFFLVISLIPFPSNPTLFLF